IQVGRRRLRNRCSDRLRIPNCSSLREAIRGPRSPAAEPPTLLRSTVMNHSITQIAFIRMTTRDNVFLWLGVAGLLIIAAAVWFTRDTSSIGYHLRQLQATRILLRYAN